MSWAEVSKVNGDFLNAPLDIKMHLADYKMYGEDSYVFQQKELLHGLYECTYISMNDRRINGEALDYLLKNNKHAGEMLTQIVDLERKDVFKTFRTMQAVLNSSTAMQAVLNSSTAMTAVANSSTAMTAVANSSTAMTAVANSSTAMQAVLNSSTAMQAVLNSSTAMTAVANSSTAMTAVANSSTAMTAVANSSTAMTAVANSSTAMTAVANSKLSKTVTHIWENRYQNIGTNRCIITGWKMNNTGGGTYSASLNKLFYGSNFSYDLSKTPTTEFRNVLLGLDAPCQTMPITSGSNSAYNMTFRYIEIN